MSILDFLVFCYTENRSYFLNEIHTGSLPYYNSAIRINNVIITTVEHCKGHRYLLEIRWYWYIYMLKYVIKC